MILNSVIRSVKTGMFPEAMMSGGTVRTEPDVKSTRKWNTWDRKAMKYRFYGDPQAGRRRFDDFNLFHC